MHAALACKAVAVAGGAANETCDAQKTDPAQGGGPPGPGGGGARRDGFAPRFGAGRRRWRRPGRMGRRLWMRLTVAARLRPSFLIIGAQKCGTTALLRALRLHPLVLAPVRKEIHYFDHGYDRGPRWYRSHFPARRGAAYVTGEASPSYLMHPLAPSRAAAFDPDMKLVAILRDPVERALSHHAMTTRKGQETLPFEAAVDAEAERLSGCRANLFSRWKLRVLSGLGYWRSF